MRTGLIARVFVWFVVAAPWLTLLPMPSSLLAIGLSVITLVCAFHGYGLLLARIARLDGLSAPLLVHWGLAALLGIAGVLMTLRAYGHAAQTILVFTGAGLHTGLVILDRDRRRDRTTAWFDAVETRFWLLPALLLAAVATLHVLGAAGDVGARPFDDDGNHLAQVRRLFDTGTLGDPIGFVRGSQLGGQVVAGAFANVLGDAQLLRVIDGGLGFGLVLWLALTRFRPRDVTTGVWSILLIFVAASYPYVATDPSMRWLATSLILALHITFRDLAAAREAHPLWPIGLVAGALATLRLELVPVAIAAVIGAGIVGRARLDLRRLVALVAVPLAVVLPYVIVRFVAKSSVTAEAFAMVASHRADVVVVLGTSVAIIAVSLGLARLIRDASARWIAITTIAGCAGIASQITGARPYATAFLWPILVGAALALAVEALRAPRASPSQPSGPALAAALLACALIYEGRDTTGRVRWVRRYADLIANVEYLRHAPIAAEPNRYASLLAHVPAGATVAVWVNQPETLDFARHRIVDLRGPRVARLRDDPGLARLVDGTRADFLMIEDDHRDLVSSAPDALAAFALRHPVAATKAQVRVVDLGR